MNALTGMKILLVDDTPANIDVLRGILSKEGYEISISMTGEAALTDATSAGYSDAVTFIRTDVAREEDIIAMLDHAVDRFGHLWHSL